MLRVKFEVDLERKTTIEFFDIESEDLIEERLIDWASTKGAKNPEEQSTYEIIRRK